jgi:hypothetical protein
MDREEGDSPSVNFGGETTRKIGCAAVSVPEVPVTVIVNEPVVAVLVVVRVSRLVPVVGFGAKEAVTPFGRPVAVRFTLPVKPSLSKTVMVEVTEAPCPTVKYCGEDCRAKLGICPETVVVAVRFPEVPVTRMEIGSGGAELLAVRVSRLVPVVGFGVKDAVTP